MTNPSGSNTSPSPDDSPDIKQEVGRGQNQVIGQVYGGNVFNVGDGGTVHFVAPPQVNPLETSKKIPQNLPRSGVVEFVGRSQKLEDLHTELQKSDRIVVTAVRGMGGIGKTELALQYAIAAYNQEIYPGGVCWLRSRDQEIATQIISFAKTKLELTIPDDLEAQEQVDLIWGKWPVGNVLIVIDDVTDYEAIAPYLPPSDPRFKVLITTRQNFGASVTSINVEELSDESAIALLKSIVGDVRIESQLADAEALCQWVGNLPLGLELLGRFLARKPDWAIAKLLDRLESKRLDAKALVESKTGMTATLGVAAALELSWTELNDQEQELACLLGMFAVAPIPWHLVVQCFEDDDPDDVEEWRDGLRDRSLIKRVEEGVYQLHQILQEFFREKLKQKGDDAKAIKTAFVQNMVAQAQILDDRPTLEQIDQIRDAIAHLEEIAQQWLKEIKNQDKILPFIGIGRFYQEQGSYGFAELWYKKCLNDLRQVFGSEHPDVATSLVYLALLHRNQGRYEEAEPLFLQALELFKKLLGKEHPSVATSLVNLAALYLNQGRYEEAEPLFLQALKLREKLLGKEHPDVASSLGVLAFLYEKQGRYEEAEPLFLQALELFKKLLGKEHPSIASNLNNLALFYLNQGRYEEAEPLFLQAFELNQKLLGKEHPDVATSLLNLANLYRNQGRYEEAEPLFLQALDLYQKLLGKEHPDIATSLVNLAALYLNQQRYEEAEPLFLQALKLFKKLLGKEHPSVATSYLNLGILYDQQGNHPKAKSMYLKSLEIYTQTLNLLHPNIKTVQSQLNNLPSSTEAIPPGDLGL